MLSPLPVRAVLCAALATLLFLSVSDAWAQSDVPLTRIAFGSCADEELPQPIWDAVIDYKPELFLFAGDNVYGDVTSAELTELREAYARARGIHGYMQVRESVPRVLATWDDNDYGLNDGGAEFPYKEQSQALFADFWQIPHDDPRRSRPGIYYAETFGPEGKRVQVILLDTRYFRSPLKPSDEPGAPGKERYIPDPDPTKTMLGEAQWEWLGDELRKPADLRLVVSSIQVLANGHGWERWGNLPAERQKLFDLIADAGADGVILLSGDRHIGGLYKWTDGVPYPLYEMTSSGLNKFYAAAEEAGPNRIGALYGKPNFGTVDIDWWADEVILAVRGMNGTARRETTVRISDLRAP